MGKDPATRNQALLWSLSFNAESVSHVFLEGALPYSTLPRPGDCRINNSLLEHPTLRCGGWTRRNQGSRVRQLGCESPVFLFPSLFEHLGARKQGRESWQPYQSKPGILFPSFAGLLLSRIFCSSKIVSLPLLSYPHSFPGCLFLSWNTSGCPFVHPVFLAGLKQRTCHLLCDSEKLLNFLGLSFLRCKMGGLSHGVWKTTFDAGAYCKLTGYASVLCLKKTLYPEFIILNLSLRIKTCLRIGKFCGLLWVPGKKIVIYI